MTTDEAIAWIREHLRRTAGLDLGPDKAYFVEARVLPLMRRLGLASLPALVEAIAAGDASLGQETVDALLVHETHFFRDGLPFELLRAHIIPELMARAAERRELTVWCAAASSGQEAYSVAMLIHEHFPALAGWRVTFVASDISEAMLERARLGIYSQHEVNRGLPARLLVRYFEQRGIDWQVRPEIRRMVDFQAINLLRPLPPLPLLDLVLIRNVLIYFDVPTKEEVLRRVRDAMRPDGFLLLGAAETSLFLRCGLEPEEVGRAVCHRPLGWRSLRR